MKALDFEYDGLHLSDFGCIICTFDSIGTNNISMGSVITFNTSYIHGNKKFALNSAAYESCLETDFYICKNPCRVSDDKDMYFPLWEQRRLMRWLNRGEYLKFRPVSEGYENIYYEGSFYSIEKVEFAGEVIGMHLYLATNSPFAFYKPKIYKFDITPENPSYLVSDLSDDIGYVYADLEITCKGTGTLAITNSMDNRLTEICKCTPNEVITMKDMTIESSHGAGRDTPLADAFNFVFVRIGNSFRQRENRLSFSLPCSVVLSYTPTMKAGI